MLSRMTSEEQPDALCCPIGMILMEDPVMLVETGHTYERQNIEAHSEVCTPQRSCAVYCRCADCHENTGQRGKLIETRPEDWCDQKHRVEGQTDTDGPSCVLRTVKSRARPKGWCIIKG